MVTLKVLHPFVHEDGEVDEGLIMHYAEDENGVRYYILQKETGIKYEVAIDVYPCRYTYEVTDEIVMEEG